MPVAVLVRRVREAAEVVRVPRVGDVKADEAGIPVGDEERPAVVGRIHPMSERDGEAALPGGGIEAEVLLDAEARYERRMRRIRDIDDPCLSVAGEVTDSGRGRVRALGVGQAGVHERPAEIGAVADLELVEAARAAARIEYRQQRRRRRVRHVPESETALTRRGRILAEDVADL